MSCSTQAGPRQAVVSRLGSQSGARAKTRREPLHEPFLFTACVERREVRVDPAIGHGCTRSPRATSRSRRRRRSAARTSRASRARCSPSASGRSQERRRLAVPAQLHDSVLEAAGEVEIAALTVHPRLLPAAGVPVVDREAEPLEVERGAAVEALDDDLAVEVEVDRVGRDVPVLAVVPRAVPLAEPEIELPRGVELEGQRLGVDSAHVDYNAEHAKELGVLIEAQQLRNRTYAEKRQMPIASRINGQSGRPRRSAAAHRTALLALAVESVRRARVALRVVADALSGRSRSGERPPRRSAPRAVEAVCERPLHGLQRGT